MVKNDPATGKGEQTRRQTSKVLSSCSGLRFHDYARDALVVKSAAYYYFPSKEAIVQAYYETVQSEQERLCEEVFAETEDRKTRLSDSPSLKIRGDDRSEWFSDIPVSRNIRSPVLDGGQREIRRRSTQVFRKAIAEQKLPHDLKVAASERGGRSRWVSWSCFCMTPQRINGEHGAWQREHSTLL